MKETKRPRKSSNQTERTVAGFTDEERSAMQGRVKELKSAARRGSRADEADTENEVLAKIAEMSETDRAQAERLHNIIKASAPTLTAKLWYGMPAYALGGKVVCFFQPAEKFKTRYSTLGFSDSAKLDDGAMWPTSFALTSLSANDEARIGELVKKATG